MQLLATYFDNAWFVLMIVGWIAPVGVMTYFAGRLAHVDEALQKPIDTDAFGFLSLPGFLIVATIAGILSVLKYGTKVCEWSIAGGAATPVLFLGLAALVVGVMAGVRLEQRHRTGILATVLGVLTLVLTVAGTIAAVGGGLAKAELCAAPAGRAVSPPAGLPKDGEKPEDRSKEEARPKLEPTQKQDTVTRTTARSIGFALARIERAAIDTRTLAWDRLTGGVRQGLDLTSLTQSVDRAVAAVTPFGAALLAIYAMAFVVLSRAGLTRAPTERRRRRTYLALAIPIVLLCGLVVVPRSLAVGLVHLGESLAPGHALWLWIAGLVAGVAIALWVVAWPAPRRPARP